MLSKSLFLLLLTGFISYAQPCFGMNPISEPTTPLLESPSTPIIGDDDDQDDQNSGLVRAGSTVFLDEELEEVITPNQHITVVYGMHEAQGDCRPTMEDAHFPYHAHRPLIADNTLFFGVYDGHGGKHAAEYASWNLHSNIVENRLFKSGNIEQAITSGYKNTDTRYQIFFSQNTDGTTAVTALIYQATLWIANAGDAEAVGCFNGKTATCLTQRHSPDSPEELARIINEVDGAVKIYEADTIRTITEYGTIKQKQSEDLIKQQTNNFLETYTLDGHEEIISKFNQLARIIIRGGTLAISRGIGDRPFKPFCVAEPFVQSHHIDQPGFLILGCDGLWDVMSYQAAVNFVLHQLTRKRLTLETVTHQATRAIAQELVEKAISIWDHDNVTATIIFFIPNQ
jgi:serine/threonine protein phosphatase PrpC